MELAISADVSTRHVSFVETGRTLPSRRMVLHLAEHLDVPLRDRNHLLVAAGYAPVYPQRSLDAPDMAAARHAVDQVLEAHEPFPALVFDGGWNLVKANTAAAVLFDGADPELLEPPVNLLRLGLHPRGLAPRVENLPEVRARLLGQLARQVQLTGDPDTAALYEELVAYAPPGSIANGESEPPAASPQDIALPLRIRHGGDQLSFITTIATFGTPLDITLDELAIESYFPADERTAGLLRQADDRDS